MNEISINQLDELFVDTVKRASIDLLWKDDEEIEYNIFEEFDIGVHSFLHDDNLNKLLNANLISRQIYDLSRQLRAKVIDLQSNHKWDIDLVKVDEEWRSVLELSDTIRILKEKFDNTDGARM